MVAKDAASPQFTSAAPAIFCSGYRENAQHDRALLKALPKHRQNFAQTPPDHCQISHNKKIPEKTTLESKYQNASRIVNMEFKKDGTKQYETKKYEDETCL